MAPCNNQALSGRLNSPLATDLEDSKLKSHHSSGLCVHLAAKMPPRSHTRIKYLLVNGPRQTKVLSYSFVESLDALNERLTDRGF